MSAQLLGQGLELLVVSSIQVAILEQRGPGKESCVSAAFDVSDALSMATVLGTTRWKCINMRRNTQSLF